MHAAAGHITDDVSDYCCSDCSEENYSPTHTLLVAVEPSHYTAAVQEQTTPELYPVEEVNNCHDNSKVVTGQ